MQFINYEIIHKNFLDILRVNNSFENSAVEELFNCISQLKYTNFFNNKLFIVFGSIIKHNYSNYKHINKLKEYRNTHKKFIQSQGNFQITYEEIFYERVGIPKINDYIGIKSDRYIHLLDIKNKYRVNKADAKRSI